MERLTRSRYRDYRVTTDYNQVRLEQESSSFKIAENENLVEETVQLDRMCEDSKILFKHFPEEIWVMITSKMEDPTSIANLMQASPVLRNILLARRVEILFPQVWRVLGVKFETREDEVYSYNVDDMYPERDRSRFKLKKTPWCSRILTLRLVCKSWCRGVDEFYENLPENCINNHYRMGGDRKIDDVERKQEKEDQFWSGWIHQASFFDSRQTKIEEFMQHFDPTHFDGDSKRNPIFRRHIRISSQNSNRENGVFSLLSKYGHHIWFCELCLQEHFTTGVKFYTELKEVLELLPNLRTLKMTYSPHHMLCDSDCDYDSDTEKKKKPPSKKEILQLKRIIVSNPFPKLRDLEFLCVHDIPSNIFNTLVSRNNHIYMLEVTGDVFHEDYDIYTFPMPNLKQLSMTYYSKKGFENLNKPEVNWPLQKIYLDFKNCPLLSRSEIFSLLENNWSETLKELSIDTSNTDKDYRPIKIINDGSTTALNLPNIQRLRFITKEIFSLDFILPLKSLQFLEVGLCEYNFREAIVTGLRLMEKHQVVQFVGYFKRFQSSNIWNLFPNLKSFKLRKARDDGNSFQYIYTRKESKSDAGSHIKPSEKRNLWFTRPPAYVDGR